MLALMLRLTGQLIASNSCLFIVCLSWLKIVSMLEGAGAILLAAV